MKIDEMRSGMVAVLRRHFPDLRPEEIGMIVCELRAPVMAYVGEDDTGWPVDPPEEQ